MHLPQEIEVWYIIPAIRRELSQILVKKYKLNYDKVAKLLGVSKAAISQYLHKKRAAEIKFPAKIKKEIEKGAANIMKDKRVMIKEITKLIYKIKKEGIACQACKKYNKEVLKICSAKPILS